MLGRCPACKTRTLLERATIDRKAKVDWCRACRGVWFDAGELESVLDLAVAGLRPPRDAHEVRRPCPRCHRALLRFEYPGTTIPVEMCGGCRGIWIDAGEYREIESVRETLDAAGKLHDERSLPGLRGSLIGFIDRAIESLWPFA